MKAHSEESVKQWRQDITVKREIKLTEYKSKRKSGIKKVIADK